jgi:hypothetical protein
MTTPTPAQELLATVDVRDLNTLRWGPLRQICPGFVEEVELGRYLKSLLGTRACEAVRVVAHCLPDGSPSSHVFDVYGLQVLTGPQMVGGASGEEKTKV